MSQDRTAFCENVNKDLPMCSDRSGWPVLILVSVLFNIAILSSFLMPEKYLNSIRQKRFRDASVRLRLGISDFRSTGTDIKEMIFLLEISVPSVQEQKKTNSIYASDDLCAMISGPV